MRARGQVYNDRIGRRGRRERQHRPPPRHDAPRLAPDEPAEEAQEAELDAAHGQPQQHAAGHEHPVEVEQRRNRVGRKASAAEAGAKRAGVV